DLAALVERRACRQVRDDHTVWILVAMAATDDDPRVICHQLLLSGAPREQRDARDAVLAHRVVGALGHEAVLRVLAPLDDFEAGSLDRVSVAVALHGPA